MLPGQRQKGVGLLPHPASRLHGFHRRAQQYALAASLLHVFDVTYMLHHTRSHFVLSYLDLRIAESSCLYRIFVCYITVVITCLTYH